MYSLPPGSDGWNKRTYTQFKMGGNTTMKTWKRILALSLSTVMVLAHTDMY